MAGASHTLDPVELARDDISRSKRLIASTLDDLTQHHSWLESYHREERRRAERLRRQDALRRLALKRQRAAWHARRLAMTAYVATRATTGFMVQNGRAFAVWAAPRGRALGLAAARRLAMAMRWSWRTGRAVAGAGFGLSAHGFAWTVRASDNGGVIFRRHVSAYSSLLCTYLAVIAAPAGKRAATGWTRTRHRTRRFAFILETSLSQGWSETRGAVSRWLKVEGPKLCHAAARNSTAYAARTRLRVHRVARAAPKAAADARSWLSSRVRGPLNGGAERKHRALIVRPSTALVSVEVWRARLPVIRAS